MRVRPATTVDFRVFYGEPPPMTVKAWAAVDDNDRPMGIGGYYLVEGRAFVFTNNRGMSRREMVEAAHALMGQIGKLEIPVVAQEDVNGSIIMKHFGFVPNGNHWRLAHDRP